MQKSSNLVLGILRETTTPWERRVPFTPEAVAHMVNHLNIRVLIQSSSNRCYSDHLYEKAGAEIADDLTPCHVIAGIKPANISTLIANKTYVMYTRVHTGADLIIPYLKKLLESRITLVDMEKIRSVESDEMLVGSSKLAGVVGMFNSFRLVGELLLLRRGINSVLLHTGGSCYMHRNLQDCKDVLKRIGRSILEEGLPKEISPFVIGITGRGVVSKGALELIQDTLPCEVVDPKDLKSLIENPGSDSQRRVYLTVVSREHYL